jgi:ribosomal protein S18 acetylase RimI-like enzyme
VFTAAGFRADRSVVLTASSVPPVRRPGLAATIRRLAGADDWRQSAELRRACGDPVGSAALAGHAASAADRAREQEFEARKLAARRRLTETGRAAWFGAFDGGRLVAQLGLARAGGGLARYQDVETHPEFRRQGLAGTLICAAARYGADELAAARLVILADPRYQAIRLYTALGFKPAEDQLAFEQVP